MKEGQMKKVLVIDDEPDFIKVITFRLKESGYEAVSVSDSKKAVACANETHPDLILLDAKMPQINGYELLRQIKKKKSLSKIPVVFTSAEERVKLAKNTKEFGADGFLVKPFEHPELLRELKKHLG